MNIMHSIPAKIRDHTYKYKGMGMKEWGKEGLGLISQSSKVHHSKNYAHIASIN